MENEGRRPLAGSECKAMPGSRVAGPVDPNEQLLVTVHLPPKTALADPSARRISREDFATERGADPEGVAKVKAFAAAYGLHVERSEPARRTITLFGAASAFTRAFGVTLSMHEVPGGTYRGYDGAITLPASLEGHVTAVLGLDNRPQARPQIRFAATGATPFTPPQVATLYGFPAGANGTGQCVGIIELGGGFTQSDYTAYFSSLGLTAPKVTVVSVLGATSSPGTDTNADAEVMLDVEVSGGVAPGITVALYFAPNTDQGFIEAVSTAIHDTANKPAVVSISWGGPESTWAQQSVTAFNQTLADAATLGVTVCAASGDGGSSDGVSDGKAHVDFPASSPYVLGCGGTRLIGSGAAIASETVWNEGGGATGGGVSDLFALPTWQATRTFHHRQTIRVRPGEVCPTLRLTPIRRPAITCVSMAPTK
jgi:kumamolisin